MSAGAACSGGAGIVPEPSSCGASGAMLVGAMVVGNSDMARVGRGVLHPRSRRGEDGGWNGYRLPALVLVTSTAAGIAVGSMEERGGRRGSCLGSGGGHPQLLAERDDLLPRSITFLEVLKLTSRNKLPLNITRHLFRFPPAGAV
jgi:hypothetical protein